MRPIIVGRCIVILGVGLCLIGCQSGGEVHQPTETATTGASARTIEEDRAVVGACAFLEKQGIECTATAKYEVKRTKGGWTVFITDQPARPGGHRTVTLNSAYEGVELIRGE